MKHDFYQELLETSGKALDQDKKTYNRCALLRGITMLCACVCVVVGAVQNQPLWYVPGAAALLAFVVLVGWHSQIVARQAQDGARHAVAQSYLDRRGDAWKQSPVDGSAYLTADFPQGKDLDLFGHASLYQYLCAASTPFGRDCLAAWLKTGCTDLPKWEQRQRAVAELAEKQAFSAEFQALAWPERDQKKGTSKDVWDRFQEEEGRGLPAVMGVLVWVLPALTLLSLVLMLTGIAPQVSQIAFSFLTLLQLGLALLFLRRNNQQFGPVYRFHRLLLPYHRLAAALERESFDSPALQALQARLRVNGGAEQALRQLDRISGAVAARHNTLTLILYNALFLYDFRCARRLWNWKKQYGAHVRDWLEAIGEAEALISLGVFSQVKTVYTFPKLRAVEQPFFRAEDLRHPLIAESKAVGNDFSMEARVCIVTGSNMSGKTTFLRTVGVNLILAYAGGAVQAKFLCASPMAVCTSIRVEDNVQEGISTFYAELLRIKTIIDRSRSDAPMIALIDEIYRGTNSRDRIVGARETLRRLARPNVLTILTTHDFELCDLEKDARTPTVNCHFSERYAGKEILFDYRIQPGRCKTTNAQHLLRLVGILPEDEGTESPSKEAASNP